MLAVDVPQAAKSGYLNGHTQFHQWDPTSLVLRINFLQATISGHRSRVFNTEPCGGRPQDSEAWHDIKWFRKFDGRSLGYVQVPKASRDAHDADDHGPDVDPRPRYRALRRGRCPRLDPPVPGPVRQSPA